MMFNDPHEAESRVLLADHHGIPERTPPMRTYSPFFQTLHDESSPVGDLGRGTHYSVLRCLCWHDECQKPLKQAKHHDIAIIWDEDHDERVIELLEQLHASGLLSSIAILGERKGTANVVMLDATAKALGATGVAKLLKSIEDIAQALPDPWSAHVGTLTAPDCIIDDKDEKIAIYLQNLNMLWKLGGKPIKKAPARIPHSDAVREIPGKIPTFVMPTPAPGPTMYNYDDSEAMTVGELKWRLKDWPDNYYITFSGGLTFNGLKSYEVNQVDIGLSPMVYPNLERTELVVEELIKQ
jgi:hypothetical protein